jgi:hypothetical protein
LPYDESDPICGCCRQDNVSKKGQYINHPTVFTWLHDRVNDQSLRVRICRRCYKSDLALRNLLTTLDQLISLAPSSPATVGAGTGTGKGGKNGHNHKASVSPYSNIPALSTSSELQTEVDELVAVAHLRAPPSDWSLFFGVHMRCQRLIPRLKRLLHGKYVDVDESSEEDDEDDGM